MSALRDPEKGCPWDLEQDFSTIAPHTIEEAYEVADAIERNNMPDLRDELGDLLFQVVFHAQLAAEAGHFDFTDVVTALADKMTRRHPHVFADAQVEDAGEQTIAWEAQKAAERQTRDQGVLDDVPRALPALRRAAKLGSRAASVGFDWPGAAGAREKIDEELSELDAEISGDNKPAIEREAGDVLLAIVNLARHLQFDPETALQGANNRFRDRFRHIEQQLAGQGRRPEEADLAELEALWQAAKQALRS
ncbi:MAG: nucleoside triphosphate pyrophosphohydrolase [Gammaproteobacteria bacterium]|nr:nucleoside triphosphate pyrophosphohydrolase [Gammaproteobacteria bacterium]